MLPNFSYVRPNTLAEATKQLATPGARVHAGGTDLLPWMRGEPSDVQKVVSLSRLNDLRGIETDSSGGLRLGALATLSEVARHPAVNQKYAALAKAAAAVGSPQLRNQGTIGGNLCQRPRCWYFRGDFHCARKGGDTCYAMQGENEYHCIFGGSTCLMVHPSDTATALVALDGRANITGPRGNRSVALESFFLLPEQEMSKENVLEPGEILTDVVIPAPPVDFVSTYRKVRARGAWDFATTAVAVALSFKQGKIATARVVLGAAAAIPWRAKDAEKLLVGGKLDAKTIGLVAAAAVKGAEPLEQNGYKVPMFRGLIQEVLEGLAPAPARMPAD
jgi:xanthine dehydrogenase YagS FAD-binding subunit